GGLAFPTQPVVSIRDAGGNLVTLSSASVTMTITAGSGAGGATLSGTTTVAAVSGVATFGGLSINKSGTNYTLTATASLLANQNSATFNVTVGPAAQLIVTGPSTGQQIDVFDIIT